MSDVYARAIEVINDYITEKHLRMVIDMPEGTQETTVRGPGPATVDFYLLSAAIRPVFMAMLAEMRIGKDKAGEVLDGLWAMIRADALEELGGDGE